MLVGGSLDQYGLTPKKQAFGNTQIESGVNGIRGSRLLVFPLAVLQIGGRFRCSV